MHISYKPLWHTLLERDMRKEDLRLEEMKNIAIQTKNEKLCDFAFEKEKKQGSEE